MSVLLRHPATVPALFSRAVDPDPLAPPAPGPWRRIARVLPMMLAVALAVEMPIVEAAAAVGRALPH